MHVILTGATGLVGSGVLHHILALTPEVASAKNIKRVSVISRRPEIPLLHHIQRPKDNTFTEVDVIQHPDFIHYPDSLLSQLEPSDESEELAVIWALGMSQTEAKSPAQYTEVTKTYAVNAATALTKLYHPRRVNFVFVSGEGATKSPGLLTPLFGRVKGETEQELLGLMKKPGFGNLRVFNARPGAVDPANQPAVHDWWWKEKLSQRNVAYRGLAHTIMPMHRVGVCKSFHSPTDELGMVLLELGIGNGDPPELHVGDTDDEGRTIRNSGLRLLGGSCSEVGVGWLKMVI